MAEVTVTPELTRAPRKKQSWFSRRYRAPRKLRVTREGWIFILVTVGVGAAAINTGNNLLFLVLGLLLSLIIISGLMSESTLRRLTVERHIPPRIHARMPSLIEVTLRNHKRRLPSYSVELEDLLEGWSTDKRCYFLKVAPRGQQTAAYRTVIPRRGPLVFTGYRVATRFPFALFEKWREIELPGEVVVYPELVAVPKPSGSQQRQEGESGRQRPGHGEEIHGLRELRTGDDVRSIHWRTSARRGRLMVREHEEEESRNLCIYLDNARSPDSDPASPDPAVERAISVASSIVVERTTAGQSIQLSTRGDVGPSVTPGASPDRLLRFLALLPVLDASESETPFGRLPHGETLMIARSARVGSFDGAVIAIEGSSQAAEQADEAA